MDTILTTSGLYDRTFQNMLRCDSTVHLHLTVAEPEPTIENDYICEGELYTGYGYNVYLNQIDVIRWYIFMLIL